MGLYSRALSHYCPYMYRSSHFFASSLLRWSPRWTSRITPLPRSSNSSRSCSFPKLKSRRLPSLPFLRLLCWRFPYLLVAASLLSSLCSVQLRCMCNLQSFPVRIYCWPLRRALYRTVSASATNIVRPLNSMLSTEDNLLTSDYCKSGI